MDIVSIGTITIIVLVFGGLPLLIFYGLFKLGQITAPSRRPGKRPEPERKQFEPVGGITSGYRREMRPELRHFREGQSRARSEHRSKRPKPDGKRFERVGSITSEYRREMRAELRRFRKELRSELRYHRRYMADLRRSETFRRT